jgi:hypothetical protein
LAVLELGFVLALACADCTLPPSYELPIPVLCQQMARDYDATLTLNRAVFRQLNHIIVEAEDERDQAQRELSRKRKAWISVVSILSAGLATSFGFHIANK